MPRRCLPACCGWWGWRPPTSASPPPATCCGNWPRCASRPNLCDVAKAIYGAGADLADQWARDVPNWTPAGSAPSSPRCASMSRPRPRRESAFTTYVFGNRHRMRYPQFRAKGLCVSSGVVEAGCKQLGARLKRAGTRWTVAGANAITALRCCILSGRFEDSRSRSRPRSGSTMPNAAAGRTSAGPRPAARAPRWPGNARPCRGPSNA